jgi:EAL domain-containing protein (putative c-di-GMP-specific phosphodiesterase class I)/GGDEF domain-containing protein
MRDKKRESTLKSVLIRALLISALFLVILLSLLCANLFNMYQYESILSTRLYPISLALEKLDDNLHKNQTELRLWLETPSFKEIYRIKRRHDVEITSILKTLSKLTSNRDKIRLLALSQSINQLLWRESMLMDMALLNKEFSNRKKLTFNLEKLSRTAEYNIEHINLKIGKIQNKTLYSIDKNIRQVERDLLALLNQYNHQGYQKSRSSLNALKSQQKKLPLTENNKIAIKSLNQFTKYANHILKNANTASTHNLSNTLKKLYLPLINHIQVQVHKFLLSNQNNINHTRDLMKSSLKWSLLIAVFGFIFFSLFCTLYLHGVLTYILKPIKALTGAISSFVQGGDLQLPEKELHIIELKTLFNEFHYMEITQKNHIKNILEYSKKQEKLLNYDQHTGLSNYYFFESTFNKKISNIDLLETDLIIIYIKIIKYDEICSIFGEETALENIKLFAANLNEIDKDNKITSSIGDSKFLIMLSLSIKKDISTVLEKFKKKIDRCFNDGILDHFINFSIGAVQYSKYQHNLSMLLQYCRFSSMKIDRHTHPGYCLFNKRIEKEFDREISLKKEIGTAIKNKQMYLLYQPQYSTTDEKLIGCEALLRWEHPKYGLISPEEFIALAEKTGDILAISNFMHLTALNDYKSFFQENKPKQEFKLAINASLIELSQNDYCSSLLLKLKKFDISPTNIEVEITETIITSFSDLICNMTDTLRKNGIQIAVDDFGTGASSLERVLSINIDLLKIDKCFIPHKTNSKKKTKLLESIIQLAKNIDLKTLAEGVETKEQFEKLKLLECNYIQGYLYSKPIRAHQLKALLANRK